MVLAFGAAMATASTVSAQGAATPTSADFEKGKNAYATKDFTEAEGRFKTLLDPQTGTLKIPAQILDA